MALVMRMLLGGADWGPWSPSACPWLSYWLCAWLCQAIAYSPLHLVGMLLALVLTTPYQA